MYFSLPGLLKMNSSCLAGETWNIQLADLHERKQAIDNAVKAVNTIRKSGIGPGKDKVLFPHLPYILEENVLISDEEKRELLSLKENAKSYDAVVSIGIGGSYLGNQVLFDLFCGPYWNQLTKDERNGYPQFYFAGQNVDPVSLVELSSCISREAGHIQGRRMQVLFLVISKSGTTIEPVTAVRGLKKLFADVCDIHLMAITDKEKGRIRPVAEKEHFPCFTVPDGIGGRFSIFSQVGLVFASLAGIDIENFLKGAQMVEEACQSEDMKENPALLLAALKYIATKKYGITAEIIMPYGDKLRSFGWWYAQLLGESLGKKYDMQGNVVYNGRIPVASVGTTDMHSLTQEHQHGKKNKLIQFISVEHLPSDLSVLCDEKGVSGMVPMSRMLDAARKANEEALANEGRMSCHISISELTPFHIGALMYFFFLTIAYEGAMENVNAFDQPGVEDYKKILHEDLRKYIVRNQENAISLN